MVRKVCVLVISLSLSVCVCVCTVVSEMGGAGGLVPQPRAPALCPSPEGEGAEPPRSRASLMSHTMNRFIDASKEAIH